MKWERSYYCFSFNYILGSNVPFHKCKTLNRVLLCFNLNNNLKYKFEVNGDYRHCEETDPIIFRKLNIE